MMNKQPKKKQNILLRLIAFILMFALVTGAASLVIFRDQLNIDALRRWFTYRSLSLNDSGQAESFPYSGSPEDIFADLNGDLLVCGTNAVSLYSGSGTQYIDLQVSMVSPAVGLAEESAVIYDAGGSSLYLIRERNLVLKMECEGTLLSASVNKEGLLTTVSQESGYRGVVSVFDQNGNPRAILRLSSAYITDAVLSDDGTSLWVVTVGQTSGAFLSTLSCYNLSTVIDNEINYEIAPVVSFDLGNSVILSLKYSDGIVRALGDNGVWSVKTPDTLLSSVDWSNQYLKGYSLSGKSFSSVLLSPYRAGSQSNLQLVGVDGTTAGPLSFHEQVLSLDAAGDYFAILTGNRLDIYTSDMMLYSTLTGTQGARKVLLRPDGSAILISVNSARLYVPS